ncbi:helicase Cas3 [uncultured Eubacterium sp.]|uniref:CRISPR-associated helicase Cas3' n=1 Tax=Brotomerdimonas butyrica TaxID=2981721 RepID=UPI000821A15C|nr:CRISPR-associated helicase Cas3' [Brotomerdimonas butyrica]MCU6756503.1 CRISPR-associated helicase Cas3' [Brotomerdimonas butyrica]SCH87747.1 helicase Cas3 [uncultured Eubacterium sp.]
MEYYAKSEERSITGKEKDTFLKSVRELKEVLHGELADWELAAIDNAAQKVKAGKNGPQKLLKDHLDETVKCAEGFFVDHGKYFSEKEIKLIIAACRYHDIGKANEVFQDRITDNEKLKGVRQMPHGHLSALSVSWNDFKDIDERFTEDDFKVFITAVYHHHTRDDEYKAKDINGYAEKYYNKSVREFLDDDKWEFSVGNIRKVIFRLNQQCRNSDVDDEIWREYILVKGMLNKFDWSVSAGYSEAEQHPDLIEKKLKSSIEKSLDGNLRPAQEYMREHSEDNLVVIAPTGSGKTEAALLWLDGEKGFYTLPMMVSSDAIYDRIRERYEYKEAALLHSGSMKKFLKESSEKGDGYSRYEKAKLLSAPLTVCTVDQLFKFSYKAAGTEIFAATLKYSKVVIDEIQSYSPRVVAALIYGLKTISEMGGRFAIITATFPPVLKKLMEEHGLRFGEECYLQDFSGESELKRHIVSVTDGEMDINEILESAHGRKVLVICNTVRKAQRVYDSLREMNSNVKLLHAGFIRKHRDLLEKSIMDFSVQEGAEGIWVTTQIVEASLDIDFDILYTEMCPIDSLLQRMGRCNRSGRYFPEHPNIIVHDTKNGRKTIYDEVIYDESLHCIRKITGEVLSEKMKTECVNEVYGSPEIENSNYYKEIKDMLRHFETILFAEYSKSEADDSFRKIRNTTVMPDSIYQKEHEMIRVCSNILCGANIGTEIKAVLNSKLDALTLNVASYDKRYRNAMDKEPIKGTFIHRIDENCAEYDFDEETLSGKGLFIKAEEQQETFMIC